MMEILTIDLTAGDTQPYAIGGTYMEIVDSVSAVDIQIIGPAGQNESMIGAEAGSYSKQPYISFLITSQTNQTIRLLVSDREGGTRRLSGAVSVTNTVDVAVQGTVPVTVTDAKQAAFTQVNVLATAAGVNLLAANAARRYCEIINTDGATVLYLNVDGNAPGANGWIPVQPGQSWSAPVGCAPNAAIKGKSAGGNINVTVLEA